MTVSESDMRMHHVHTDLNGENNTHSIISEIVQAMLIKFAVNIV